jgi:hypothetical protein
MSNPPHPACEEKARLLRRCAVAESNRQRAIQRLTWILGAERKPHFKLLNEFAEAARDIAENAQRALERHTAEHGC